MPGRVEGNALIGDGVRPWFDVLCRGEVKHVGGNVAVMMGDLEVEAAAVSAILHSSEQYGLFDSVRLEQVKHHAISMSIAVSILGKRF